MITYDMCAATPMTDVETEINAKAMTALKEELYVVDERIRELSGGKAGSKAVGIPAGGWGTVQLKRDDFRAQVAAVDPSLPPVDMDTLTNRMYGEGAAIHLSTVFALLKAHSLHRYSMPLKSTFVIHNVNL